MPEYASVVIDSDYLVAQLDGRSPSDVVITPNGKIVYVSLAANLDQLLWAGLPRSSVTV
jgi:hypothetical protein